MSKKHNRNRLILARRILTVLAVVLFCVTLFSGYMYFFGARPVPAEPEVTQATAPDTFPTETAATEVPTTETAPPEESTEAPAEAQDVSGEVAPTSAAREENAAGGEDTPESASNTQAPAAPANQENLPDQTEPEATQATVPETFPTETAATEVTTTETVSPEESTEASAEAQDVTGEVTPTSADKEETTAGGEGNPPVADKDTPTEGESGSNTQPPAAPTNNGGLPDPMEDLSPGQEAFQASVQPGSGPDLWGLIFWSSAVLLAGDLGALLLVSWKIRKTNQACNPLPSGDIPRTVRTGRIPDRYALNVGTLHQPGRRQYQQDSLGHSIVLDGKGVLAVVADGMGGLADGDKVSQQIVLRALELGAKLQSDQANGALYRILNQVNEDINRMLTPDGLYKCGSTMIAVLVQGRSFQWISVGDSRIYLYREGYVNRLNRDHDLLQEWMPEILSGQRSMEASLADPNARKLTSFIGMGRLKYVDGSTRPIDLLPGDRLLLLSDGVYGEVPEERMAAILKQYPDVRQAAAALGQQVQANQNPHQDNYTALILGF